MSAGSFFSDLIVKFRSLSKKVDFILIFERTVTSMLELDYDCFVILWSSRNCIKDMKGNYFVPSYGLLLLSSMKYVNPILFELEYVPLHIFMPFISDRIFYGEQNSEHTHSSRSLMNPLSPHHMQSSFSGPMHSPLLQLSWHSKLLTLDALPMHFPSS